MAFRTEFWALRLSLGNIRKIRRTHTRLMHYNNRIMVTKRVAGGAARMRENGMELDTEMTDGIPINLYRG